MKNLDNFDAMGKILESIRKIDNHLENDNSLGNHLGCTVYGCCNYTKGQKLPNLNKHLSFHLKERSRGEKKLSHEALAVSESKA